MNPVTVPGFVPASKTRPSNGSASSGHGTGTSFDDTLRSKTPERHGGSRPGEREPLARLVARFADAMDQSRTATVSGEHLPTSKEDPLHKDAAEPADDDNDARNDDPLFSLMPLAVEVANRTRPSADAAPAGEVGSTTSSKAVDGAERPRVGDRMRETAGIDVKIASGAAQDPATDTRSRVAPANEPAVAGATVAYVDGHSSSNGNRAKADIAAFFAGQRMQVSALASDGRPVSKSADAEPGETAAIEVEVADPDQPAPSSANTAPTVPVGRDRPSSGDREPTSGDLVDAADPDHKAGATSDGPVLKAVDALLAPPRAATTVTNLAVAIVADVDPTLKPTPADPSASTGVSSQTHMLKIQLNPIELGMVTATLRMAGDQLTVELTTEKIEAYERLNNDSDAIVKSLRGLGLQVDQVTVQPPQVATTGASRPDGNASMQASSGREQQFAQTGNMGGGERQGQGDRSAPGGFQNASQTSKDGAPLGESHRRGGLVI